MPKATRLLTVKEVNAITKPGLTAVGGVTGLYLYIDPKSSGRSYVLRYTNACGKRCHISVGPASTITLKEARTSADEMRRRLLQGIDPIEDRRNRAIEAERVRQVQSAALEEEQRTVAFCAEQFINERAQSGFWNNNRRGESVARAYFKNHINPVIGHIPISKLTAKDVYQMLLPIWQSTTDTGKNCRSSVFQLYRWALARGWCNGDNPADSKGVLAVYLEPLKTARKKPQNYPAADFREVPLLIRALMSKKTSSYLLTAFSVVTVLRAKMARLARWSDVDLEKRILRIPEANFKTKGRGDHIVYLSSAAIKILTLLPRYSTAGYLFPSPRTMQALSDNAMRAVIQQLHEEKLSKDGIGWIDPILSQKMGKPCMITQHATARASFKTWASSGENRKRFDVDAVELCLAHHLKDDYNGAYNRSTLEEERRAVMEAWGDYCLSQAGDLLT